jgi:hypothetical protein
MTEFYFTKLKFLKDKKFRFWSKKNKELFFSYTTINEGVEAYKREHKSYLYNKLNVYFTWQLLLKYLPLAITPFIIFLFGIEMYFTAKVLFAIFVLSLLSKWVLNNFANKFYTKYKFTTWLINNIENYEDEREIAKELIEKYENKKTIFNL